MACLTISDLSKVREFLYDVRRKWYNIGLQLNILITELDVIKDKSMDPADSLLEVIRLWLRSIEPLPTWRILADALRNKVVDEVKLAAQALQQIESEAAQKPNEEKLVNKAIAIWIMEEMFTLSSFHGAMDVNEAENRLREQNKDCCYLTRWCKIREEHTLSVLRRKEDDYVFQNFDILIRLVGGQTTLEIPGSQQKFSSVVELLTFYKEKPLNHLINGIGDEVKGDKTSTTPIINLPFATETQNGIEEPENEQEANNPFEFNCTELLHGSSIERFQDEQSLGLNFQKRKIQYGPQNAVPQWALNAMKDQPSFHGSISRTEAAKILIESGGNCYLTRYSDYHNSCVVSVLRRSDNGDLLQHLKLNIPDENGHVIMCKLAGTEIEFGNISKLLEYYQKHPLNENGHLGKCLKSKIWKSIDYFAPDPPEVQNGISDVQEQVELTLQDIESHPTFADLCCISYQNNDGKMHDFKLLEQISDRWWKAGMLLSLTKNVLDIFRDKAEDNVKSCEHVFSTWVSSNGHKDYPLTWAGLHTLLVDMGRRTAAEKLYDVLKKKGTDYVDTLLV